nr:MAG TPA: hypothetical protein [Caudoviricetes sp.]
MLHQCFDAFVVLTLYLLFSYVRMFYYLSTLCV